MEREKMIVILSIKLEEKGQLIKKSVPNSYRLNPGHPNFDTIKTINKYSVIVTNHNG